VSNRRAEYERIAGERLAAERDARRETRRDFLRASAQCVGFCAAGLCIMFFAFYVNDVVVGRAFLWGGMVVGYGGIAYTLLSAYRRGEARGDW
jgi:hypothetical protein